MKQQEKEPVQQPEGIAKSTSYWIQTS